MRSVGACPVVLFDLWGTLATSYCREPIWDVQKILGYRDGRADDGFLRFCLTTDIREPDAFLYELAITFCRPLTLAKAAAMKAVIDAERRATTIFADVPPVLERLRARGHRLGVVSNAWAFPMDHIFGQLGLGAYFEHRACSFEVGSRKPEAAIFREACRQFGVAPADCVMIGDNPLADVRAARAVGMSAMLIDRAGLRGATAEMADGMPLRTLANVPEILTERDTAA